MNPNFVPSYSHRSLKFKELFAKVTHRLLVLAKLDPLHDAALLITGSGTLANEIVISSLLERPFVVTRGGFSDRLTQMIEHHHGVHTSAVSVGVQYETGTSTLNLQHPVVADCVSSFPFYDLPSNSRIMTTVSSKQLLASCGLSIIFVRNYKKVRDLVRASEPSYLSLMKYIDAYDRQQTPNTPAISAIEDLDSALDHYDREAEHTLIVNRRAKLAEICGRKNIEILGTGPVLTLATNVNPIPQIDLYMNGGHPQCFLWSLTSTQTDQLVDALEAL